MPAETIIQIRRGLASTWTSLNPVLEAGEFGLETDTKKVKIGDGSTFWQDLKYSIGQVGNLNIGSGGGNSIESTFGDILLSPNGGNVQVSSNLFVSGNVYSSTNKKLATEEYVDSVKQGLDVKDSVRVATTEYIDLQGIKTIDGVSLSAGDRVLVKNQLDQNQNGIYEVSSGVWVRASDANTNEDVTPGMFAFVEQGDVNSNSGWVLITARPIVLGVTPLSFTQFSGAGQITVNGGLVKEGNAISVQTADASRIVINPNSIDLAASGVQPGEYTRVQVDEYGRVTSGANWSSNDITSLGTITSGVWNASVIQPQYGGTGISSYSSGDLVYADDVNSLSVLPKGLSNSLLKMDADGEFPEWSGVIDGGSP
jgi:formylmethanofuran dehydrogenase subunit D